MVDENRNPEPLVPPPLTPGLPVHPTVQYEPSDASFRWIVGLILGALIFGAVVHFAVQRFFRSYEAYQAEIKASRYPLAAGPGLRKPPEPRLEQVDRMAGIESGNVALRYEAKESVLKSYGPAGEGYVHIPIDRAIDMLADKLPARANGPGEEQAKRQNGLVDDGESNSGRLLRGGTP